ncbi:MAG: hypothetical protein L6Q71_00140 [Planctomycetes bacterium]|nr:hypothetical protein [Planctomycetota bacterium]NUQ34937.1 hypothetical protein [Planctomycetaceae bacterium]
MRFILCTLALTLAGCAASFDAAQLDAIRNQSAGADEAEMPKTEGMTLPENTPVLSQRKMHVTMSVSTEEQAKTATLFYTWDKGQTWLKHDGALENRLIKNKESRVFTITVDRDGLVGFQTVVANNGQAVVAPQAGTAPKNYVFVDTTKPRAMGIKAMRGAAGNLSLWWTFSDDMPKPDGVTVMINGAEALTGQAHDNGTDISVADGPLSISITCTDKAGNVSEAITAMLP